MAEKHPKSRARERFMAEYGFLRKFAGRNFRDLGGHPTSDGRRVRASMIFRSAHVAEVSERSQLRAIRLRTLVTLQSNMEVSWLGPPDTTLFGDVRWVHIPIGDSWFDDQQSLIVTRDALGSDQKSGRGHLVLITSFKEAWQRFFQVLAEREVYPLLFHCSAGRDRTGVGAAMLLELLGVERQRIVDDFLASNAAFPKELLEPEMLEPVFELIDRSGGIENFLCEQLGLARSALDVIRGDLLER